MPFFTFILAFCFSLFTALPAFSAPKSAKPSKKLPKIEKLYDVRLGETYQRNDLVLIVDNAQIAAGVLGVRYRFINNNVTKKIDLGEKFKFSLADEYGNLYHLVPTPPNYPRVTRVTPAHFPSLYPGEEVEETVFFEAPIAQSSFLFLKVDPVPAKLAEAVTIKIPMEQVGRELQNENAIEELPKEPAAQPAVVDFLTIHSPQENEIVYKGEAIRLDVEIGSGLGVPESIVVTSPDYTLRDIGYGLHYSVVVPPEYPKEEMTVVVIAKWPGEGSGKLLSDSMTFTINDLKEKCVQDCYDAKKSTD